MFLTPEWDQLEAPPPDTNTAVPACHQTMNPGHSEAASSSEMPQKA